MNSTATEAHWRPINSAHAIQSVYGAVLFSQPVTSIIWKRLVETAQGVASGIGLSERGDVQTYLMQVSPGAPPNPINTGEAGVEFFRRRDIQPPSGAPIFTDRLMLEPASFRLDCLAYTRWIGFEEKLRGVLALFPQYTQAVSVRQIALEYVDVFLATREGDVDSALIINPDSDCIAHQAFHATSEWHSHVGWFEDATDAKRVLVNVDITVTNANTPKGVRRAINIRTHQALQFLSGDAGEAAAEALNETETLTIFNDIHRALKNRLGAVLTPLGQEMISLGGN